MEFVNPFYQKDEDYVIYSGIKKSPKSNMIIPLTDYVSISLFKDHFFKWNQEHQLELMASVGTPMSQMQRVMIREMDLRIENMELK